MRYLVILLLLAASAFGQDIDDYTAFLTHWEGKSTTPYNLNGVWHIGIGHKIENQKNVPESISDDKIMELFYNDLKRTVDFVRELTPSFEEQPIDVKLVMVSVGFTVGRRGYINFVRFRRALDQRHYVTAAYELEFSSWYTQVGTRGKNHVALIEKEAYKKLDVE